MIIAILSVIIFILIVLTGYFARSHFSVRKTLKNAENENVIMDAERSRLGIYRKVVENSPDLFLLVDQGLQVVLVNSAAKEFGWASSREFFEAMISDTSKLHFEFEIKNVLNTGISTNGEIRLVRHEQDSWRYFLYHIFPIMDDDAHVIGATLTATDITAQRDAETELNRQREFIEGIMNAIPDPIHVKDDQHYWLYGNKAFSDLVGKPITEYVGLRSEDIFNAETSLMMKRFDSEVIRMGVAYESEEDIQNAKGEVLTVLSKRTPFQFQDGRKVLVSVIRDISERKKLENELRVSKDRQQEASRLATLGETAGGIAHEINNPLNVIVGLAELMKAVVEKKGAIEPEKLNDYCDRLVKYSMRIAKIIKGLRSISRDASHDPFAEVDLSVLIEEALELCEQQFLNRGIKIQYQKADYPAIIQGRFAQVSQIMMNLINNARDAVDGLQNAIVNIQIHRDDSNAIIRVWDSGAGIPHEIESKIMRPFFTTKPAGKGTGLGLSISKSIAIEHGGNLILNRKVADSCFELHLPLTSAKSQAA